MHRLIIPLLLAAALMGETISPQNYQRTELSPQQKEALVKRMLGSQAKAQVAPPTTAPDDQLCAVPLVNALRPDTPIPPIRRVPVPEGTFPMEHVKVPPACKLEK